MKRIFTQGRLSLILGLLLAINCALYAQPGGWYVNAADYQYNMSVTAQIQIGGVTNNALDNHLAAFFQDEIRGYAKPISVNGQAYYFLTVYSNIYQGDELGFRVFLGADGKVYESSDTLLFKHHATVGKIGTPYVIHLSLSPRPLIYSISTVDYAVNSCEDVLDVQSSDNQDSEGNGLTYSITGGADASKFTIDPQTGLLSWLNFTPLFLPPGDADGNNLYEVTVKVTDSGGLFDTQDITVSLVSNIQYQPLVCPPNLTVLSDSDGAGDCSALADGTQMYVLNPCVLTEVDYVLTGATTGSGMGQVPLDQLFFVGETEVTYNHPINNPSQCSFTVTVVDNELPQITCPADTTVASTRTDICAAVVNGLDAEFSDNCVGSGITYALSGASTGTGSGQLSGQIFQVGTTQVTYTVTDGAGLMANCMFEVIVEDEVPPTALCKNATVQLDQNGMATILPDDVDNQSTDACGIGTRAVLPNSFTCANVGANVVTLTVTDIHGNEATCNATVFVKALSLGNRVFNDLNRNGVLDAGDVGLNGVLCKLYADNGNGVLDAGDGAAIATFTTATLNTQDGSYLFTDLCPGNFIVEIAASNFAQGGALYDNTLMAALVSSPLGNAPDPDNDQDNDDNGAPVAGFGVASSAITLALNLEPNNDGDADKNTNFSLDFGFKTPVSVSIGDLTLSEGTGGTTTAFNFTVTRTDNVDAFALVVNTSNGTAENTSDYTAISNGSLTFAAGGSLTATVTVLVNHDNMVEANETFSVQISDPNGNVRITDDLGLGTINNDDNAVVTLSGSATLTEGSPFTFTATLNNPVQGGFSVAYTSNEGTATLLDNDFTDNDGSLSFAGTAGEAKTFTVNTVSDNKVELNETFTTNLGAITGAPAGVSTAGSPQTGTIGNDDSAVVSIAANVSQSEALTPQVFSITLSNPVDAVVTVQYSTADGTAMISDNDYNAIASQTVTFAAGTTTAQSVNVGINNDTKVEADETFQANLSALAASGRNVSIGVGTRTGTIVNEDAAVVTLSGGTTKLEGNTGTVSYQFTATLNNAVQGGFTANYSTNDGTATLADSDYQDNDGVLSFAGTTGESKTFTVLVNGDPKIEADETFLTTLNSLVGIPQPPAVTIAGAPQTSTISNDEQDWGDAPNSYGTLNANNGARHSAALGGLRLGATIDGDLDGQPNPGANGDGADEDGVTLPSALVINNNANLTVNTSASGVLNAWVDYNLDGDWADAGEQVLSNQNVAAGDNALSFAVPGSATLGSSFARFRLSTATGISFNGAAADGEVEDYAIEIVNTQFTVNDPIMTEGNAGTSNLSFVISRTVNTNACSVDYAISGGTATVADNDYQAVAAGTLSFVAGGAFSQTVNVVVNGDLKVELNETVEMLLSNPINASILDGMGLGTINNDDAAVLTISNPTVTEGDVNTTTPLTFTLQLSNPSDANVSLNYATVDGSATLANNDFVSATGSLTFSPGEQSKTVQVTGNGDCLIEANETFLLRLSALTNNGRDISLSGGGSSLDGTGTINNDDALPQITCPADQSKNVDPGVCTTSFTLPLPTLSSICGSSTLEFRYRTVDAQNNPTGVFNAYAPSANNTLIFNGGRYEVEWRITDGSGASVCSFYLSIVDNQPPTIICPPNQIINASANCSGLVGAWSPISMFDNCTPSSALLLSQSPTANTVLMGHNATANVILSTRDQSLNIASCTFTVTLRDVTPPVAKCKDGTANLSADGLVKVSAATVNNGTTDNCGVIITLTPSMFNCSNIGVNTVVMLATDAAGNTSTCTAKVTIKDVTGPVAKCKNPTVYLNSIGQGTLAAAQVNNGSTDNCGISTLSINRTSFNCSEITGTNPVTLNLTDVNGNASSCLAYAMVKDTMRPTAFCENTTVKLSMSGIAVVYPSTLADNSFDNCSVNSYSPTAKVYTTANLGNNNLTITVKDFSGNAATCVSVVTVLPFNFQSDSEERTETEKAQDLPFIVYPNPTTGAVSIAFEIPTAQTVHIRLYDLQGRRVYDQSMWVENGENTLPIQLENFAPGMYLLDFQSNDLNRQTKVSVQR